MFSKSYTAIIQKGNVVKAVDLFADYDGSDAENAIEQTHPGYDLIALVPARHAKGCHTYNKIEKSIAQRNNSRGSAKDVDIWDIRDIT